jgi:UDP-N-acetyl-D-glucosamine dehydrogenase
MFYYIQMLISIIGQGYVGLTIAAYSGGLHQIIGFDSNKSIVDQLNQGNSHVEGVESKLIAELIKQGRYRATHDPEDIADSEIVIIAVPTPLDDARKPDLSFIDAACKVIGENLITPALIINESTSYPGTLRDYIKPAIDKYSKVSTNHLFAVSPERVDPGRNDYNQKNTPRLFSGLTPEASEKTREFYSGFCENLIEVSAPEVAEAAKLFENTFRQVNIALVNEFAQISHALGIDVRETLNAADSKPFGFMKFSPGVGVGGHCIPIDPTYLSHVASQAGVKATFIERANEVNRSMPKYIAERIANDHDGSLAGKTIIIIGVAYKANVADTRESPALLLIEALESLGAVVKWHDPIVKSWRGQNSHKLELHDIAVVVTKHDTIKSEDIEKCARYVFDTTGLIKNAIQL